MSYPIVNYVTCANFSDSHNAFLAAIVKIVEPRFYREAAKDSKWKAAMEEEIRALEKYNTWVLQDLPKGKNPISYKWVYRVKLILTVRSNDTKHVL